MRIKCTGLIAAAGESKRMGRPKALLPYGATTFAAHLSGIFLQAECSPVVVTIPRWPVGDEIRTSLKGYGVMFSHNDAPSLGQQGSVRTAIRLGNDADALVVCPVDAPFATSDLVKMLMLVLEKRAERPTIAVAKACNGSFGHPIGISKHFFSLLLREKLPHGLRDLFARFPDAIVGVASEGNAILANINEPHHFKGFLANPSCKIAVAAATDAPRVNAV